MKRTFLVSFMFATTLLLTACGSGGGNMTPSRMPSTRGALSNSSGTASILQTLTVEQTIGSTISATPKDVNPYGLDVAKVTSGVIAAGDLIVCNFNNPGNVQGTGTTIVALHPAVGATPLRIAKSNDLMGCNALATAPNGTIWTAAFKANDNPVLTSDGSVETTLHSQSVRLELPSIERSALRSGRNE